MCTEDDIIVARSQSQSSASRRESRVSKDVIVTEPTQTKRDLFEEDQDNDIREREADGKDLIKSHQSDGDDDVVFVEKVTKQSNSVGKVSKESGRRVSGESSRRLDRPKRSSVESRKVTKREEEYSTDVVSMDKSQDQRRVVSEGNASFEVSDERVVEFGSVEGNGKEEEEESQDEMKDDDDGVNIYEDMPQDLDLCQAEGEVL